VRDFAGKPLIVHSIEQALACPEIDAVYVSTDDEAIAAVARAAGATVPYLRPAELAGDSAPKLPVIEHLVRFLERQGQAVVRVVDLQPTSPLRDAADISARQISLSVSRTRRTTPISTWWSGATGAGCT